MYTYYIFRWFGDLFDRSGESNAYLLRGAVFFVSMSLWGIRKVENLDVTFASVLPSIRQVWFIMRCAWGVHLSTHWIAIYFQVNYYCFLSSPFCPIRPSLCLKLPSLFDGWYALTDTNWTYWNGILFMTSWKESKPILDCSRNGRVRLSCLRRILWASASWTCLWLLKIVTMEGGAAVSASLTSFLIWWKTILIICLWVNVCANVTHSIW